MGSKLEDLDADVRAKAEAALREMRGSEKLRSLGADGVAVIETKRTLAVQMAYYARGRMKNPEDVKAMYKAAGLYTPTDEECATANTWTLKSRHLSGRAVDLAPTYKGRAWWTAPDCVWRVMGEIGEANGLAWGGRWKERDLPHFEG